MAAGRKDNSQKFISESVEKAKEQRETRQSGDPIDFRPMWNQRIKRQEKGITPLLTERFFNDLREEYESKMKSGKLITDFTITDFKSEFESSTKPIIHFGGGSGTYLQKSGLFAKRKCIIYDYASEAVATAAKKGFETRLVDLNKTDPASTESPYQHLLKDLSNPVDILAIGIMDYLSQDAIVVLLYFLLTHAKSGSTFYFQTSINSRSASQQPSFKIKDVPHGFIASIFGPKFNSHYRYHSIQDRPKESVSTDGLIVSKR